MRYTDFHISISVEEVCRLLDGHKSTLGGELAEELEEMLPEAFERLEPQAFLGVGDTEGVLYEEEAEEGQEALYVITTVGEALSGWSGELFREGDCVKAMLADAIADHCLFQMDRQLREPVRLPLVRGVAPLYGGEPAQERSGQGLSLAGQRGGAQPQPRTRHGGGAHPRRRPPAARPAPAGRDLL